MEIEELPDYIDICLKEADAVAYPRDGEIHKSYQLRMYCFSGKNYLDTWALRQRLMNANMSVIAKAPTYANQSQQVISDDEENENKLMDVNAFRMMMLMSDFDVHAAIEEFKQLVVKGKLIELDEGVYLSLERFNMIDGQIIEEMLMTYLSVFILPCAQKNMTISLLKS